MEYLLWLAGITVVFGGFAWWISRRSHPEALPTDLDPPLLSGPTYEIEPRLRALDAASRYHWSVTLAYWHPDGTLHEATADNIAIPPPSKRVGKVMTLTITIDGHQIPLSQIKDIVVNAATENAKKQYSVYG